MGRVGEDNERTFKNLILDFAPSKNNSIANKHSVNRDQSNFTEQEAEMMSKCIARGSCYHDV